MGCYQIKAMVITTRLPRPIFLGTMCKGTPMVMLNGGIILADSKCLNTALQFQVFLVKAVGFAKTGECPPMWMWCSTSWEGLGTTSPVQRVEGNFFSKSLTSAGWGVQVNFSKLWLEFITFFYFQALFLPKTDFERIIKKIPYMFSGKITFLSVLNWFLEMESILSSVGGIVVSIAAFQAVDPGSIPGRRSFCLQQPLFPH